MGNVDGVYNRFRIGVSQVYVYNVRRIVGDTSPRERIDALNSTITFAL